MGAWIGDNSIPWAKNIDGMNGSIGGVSKGIHIQSIMLAMNEMIKPDNTKYMTLTNANIVPMIPSAKGLAEMLTQDELAGVAYIWLSEINTCTVDSLVLSKEQKDAYDLSKWIKLNAIQLVAAFTPEATINDMIDKQIIQGGSYVQAAYAIITLRQIFTKDFLLSQSLNASTELTTPSQYESILNYLDTLNDINSYSFKDNLNFKLFGYYDTDNIGLNQTVSTYSSKTLVEYYYLLNSKFDKELSPVYKNNKALSDRLNQIQSRIQKGLHNE